jgi:hypothetical protein
MVDVKTTETETVNETPAPPAAPVKKSNTALIVIIVLLVVFLVLPTLGGVAFWFLVGSKVKDATTDLNNGKLNLNLGGNELSVNNTDSQKWPDTVPALIPKFTAGKINSVLKVGEAWYIGTKSVTVADYNSYLATLKSAGFKVSETIEIDTTKSTTASKDDYSVSVSYALTANEPGIQLVIARVAAETPAATTE